MGTWNVRSFIKVGSDQQEMARVNFNILGISVLKWTGMSEINSDLVQAIKSTTVDKNPLEEME